VVQRIATFNKQPFPEKEFNKVVESSRKLETNVEKSYTVLDLLRYPVLRKRSLILGLIWYVIYTGSARSVPNSVSLNLTILIYTWRGCNGHPLLFQCYYKRKSKLN
jgi:hypothetical protein